MKVRCVYRVHSRGEVLDGFFDTEQGIVLECPELCQVNMEGYHYLRDAYNGAEDLWDYLHYMLQANPYTIAAAGYNREGCILVGFEEAHAVYSKEGWAPAVGGPLKRRYCLKTECIGIAKTQIRQYGAPTRRALVVVDKTGTNPVIHTKFGRKRVGFRYDSLVPGKPIGSQGADKLCTVEAAYGTCLVNGEPRLLTIGEHSVDYLERG